jgi:hypothetical protein
MITQDSAPKFFNTVKFTIDATRCLITLISASAQLPTSILFFIEGPIKYLALPTYTQSPNCLFNKVKIVDDNKNYDSSMVQYSLSENKLVIAPINSNQAQTYNISTKMNF